MLVVDTDFILCHLSDKSVGCARKGEALTTWTGKNASGSSSEIRLTGFTKT